MTRTFIFTPTYVDTCELAPTPHMARALRRALVRPRKGHTTDVTCGNPLCVAEDHVYARRWKSFGGKWPGLARKIARLQVGESLDLPTYPTDSSARSRLRGGIQATNAGRLLKFTTSALPTGGIRITRTGTW